MHPTLAVPLAAVLALSSHAVRPAPTAPPPRAGDPTRLIGTWQCGGYTPHSSSVETYARGPGGEISLQNAVATSAGATGSVVETFAYDAPSDGWRLTAPANAFFGGLRLEAHPWLGATWTFEGTEIERAGERPVRIVYTDLGPGAFTREHQVRTGDRWTDDAEFACRRIDPYAVAAAPPQLDAATPAARADRPRTAAERTQAAVAEPSAAPAPARPSPVPAALATPPELATPESPGTEAPALHPAPTPSPRPRPRPAPTARTVALAQAHPTAPPSADRAYRLVGAPWKCLTIQENPATHAFALGPNGAITLRNVLHAARDTFEIDETYRYDPRRKLWTNRTQGDAYVGVAPPWTGADWTFQGVESEDGRRDVVRMIYSTLGDHAFRRDFQRLQAGAYATYMSETCQRP